MKHLIATALTSLLFTGVSANAEIKFYGKINASLELASEGDEDHTQLQSNASRVGVKGNEVISDQLQAIYQLEYQVRPDDSGADTFDQRNSYLGVKGGFGSVIAGYFDTPLKRAQNKVDLFNDLHGDIKHVITVNDNRGDNSVMYISPEFSGGVQLYVDYINSENEAVDDGVSLAATYTNNDLYLAIAADSDVEEQGAQAVRFVAQYKLSKVKLGFLAEQYEADGADTESGVMASASYKFDNNLVLNGQVGQSDIHEEGGLTYSVGLDKKYTKTFKAFGFYTRQEADDDAFDNNYLGVGLELKFSS